MNALHDLKARKGSESRLVFLLQLFGAAGFGAVLAVLIGTVGAMDYADALTAEAVEKDARPARVTEHDRHAPQRYLSLPLDYDATVTQSSPGEMPRTRFYVKATNER